jgi:hypothetical protein
VRSCFIGERIGDEGDGESEDAADAEAGDETVKCEIEKAFRKGG